MLNPRRLIFFGLSWIIGNCRICDRLVMKVILLQVGHIYEISAGDTLREC